MLRSLKPADFADERFGLPTVTDILGELEKPGRDPRPAFTTAAFAEGVEKMADLKPGMVLEGVVTNVAAFGAFVDVGVHQDGLVHVSALSKGSSATRARSSSPATSSRSRCSTSTCRASASRSPCAWRSLAAPGQASGGKSGDSRPRPERQPADSDRRQRNDRGGQRGNKGSSGRTNGGRDGRNRQPEPEGAMAAACGGPV